MEEKTLSGTPKISRAVRLSPHIDAKLVAVCDRLGVNINAYLIAEIGKAVNRDYLQFEVAESQKDALRDFISNMESAMHAELSKDQ